MRITRLISMPYSTSFTSLVTWPRDLISPPSARPRPGEPPQPRKKPVICHSASRPRQPGITGSPSKWHLKNQRSGLTSSSARTWPRPNAPPLSSICGDAVEHQHRRKRQLGIAGAEELAPAAGQQCIVVVGMRSIRHAVPCLKWPCSRVRVREIGVKPTDVGSSGTPSPAAPLRELTSPRPALCLSACLTNRRRST